MERKASMCLTSESLFYGSTGISGSSVKNTVCVFTLPVPDARMLYRIKGCPGDRMTS